MINYFEEQLVVLHEHFALPDSVTAKDSLLPAPMSMHLIELRAGINVSVSASEQLGPSPRRPYSLRPIT